MVNLPPLNTDLRAWALVEITRLEAEVKRLTEENEALKAQVPTPTPHESTSVVQEPTLFGDYGR